jgi:hypothetical protein
MSIDVQWDNVEKTVARWIFSGVWTWDDFARAQAQSHTLLRSVKYSVDVIADMRETSSLPRDAFVQFRKFDRAVPPNRDRVVLVTTNQFICTMAKAFNQMFPHQPTHFILAASLNEARELLMRSSQRRSISI